MKPQNRALTGAPAEGAQSWPVHVLRATAEGGPVDGDDLVWLSTLRRGIAHHSIDGRHTTCGRFVGEIRPAPNPRHRLADRGSVVELAEAREFYRTVPCARCYGTAEVVAPRVVPSRDREGAK